MAGHIAGVVRVGDTVRRPRTARSDVVRRLLRHLAAKGFDGAPDHLGTDAEGRDILTFIPGEVPDDLGFHDDTTLIAAAILIRRFHDATADLADPSTGAEVVCHNDLSPCNFVFRDGVPVAMIDFDAAAPGTRADDLGYAAWLWLDIGTDEITADEQARRLGVLLDAYGTDDRPAIVAAMLARQASLAAEGGGRGDRAMAAWATACHAWTERHRALLTRR